MADLITSTYAQQAVPALATVNAPTLASGLSAASSMIRRFCRQNFIPTRYIELHDATGELFLMLRQTPILGINSLTLFPDTSNPIVILADQLDIRPQVGRISIKPEVAAGFSGFPWIGGGLLGTRGMGFSVWPLNAIQVDYNAGYGFLTQSSTAVAAGNSTVTPPAMTGPTPADDLTPWTIAPGTILTLDAGNANAESVTVLTASPTAFTASFANAHGAGCQILGWQIPDDLQLACALLVGNLVNQPDLTKQRESMGKTVGYEYVVRSGDLLFTPEILNLLSRYRDIVV